MSENKKFIPLSGTFLDAIACDIPSNNWTPDIWEREFVRYNEIGIDEAYIIRVGWQDSSCYKSEVMKTTLYNENDMVQLFLDLGQKYHVGIYIGLYDTSRHWLLNDWENEIAINRELPSSSSPANILWKMVRVLWQTPPTVLPLPQK